MFVSVWQKICIVEVCIVFLTLEKCSGIDGQGFASESEGYNKILLWFLFIF